MDRLHHSLAALTTDSIPQQTASLTPQDVATMAKHLADWEGLLDAGGFHLYGQVKVELLRPGNNSP